MQHANFTPPSNQQNFDNQRTLAPMIIECFHSRVGEVDYNWEMKTYSSNNSKTSDGGWWMVQRMVLPRLTMDFRAYITLCAIKESKPEVASSQNIKGGLVSSWNHKAATYDKTTFYEIKVSCQKASTMFYDCILVNSRMLNENYIEVTELKRKRRLHQMQMRVASSLPRKSPAVCPGSLWLCRRTCSTPAINHTEKKIRDFIK